MFLQSKPFSEAGSNPTTPISSRPSSPTTPDTQDAGIVIKPSTDENSSNNEDWQSSLSLIWFKMFPLYCYKLDCSRLYCDVCMAAVFDLKDFIFLTGNWTFYSIILAQLSHTNTLHKWCHIWWHNHLMKLYSLDVTSYHEPSFHKEAISINILHTFYCKPRKPFSLHITCSTNSWQLTINLSKVLSTNNL